jgi:hypothetical protein
MYFPKYTTLKIGKLQIFTHIMFFQSRIKSICGEIKFRENFKYKGKKWNVKHAFIEYTKFELIIMRVEENYWFNNIKDKIIKSLTKGWCI